MRLDAPPSLAAGSATRIGAISGGAWFIAWAMRDQGWAVPLSSGRGIASGLASAVVTGIAVAHLFRRPIQGLRGPWFQALLLAMLPTAIVLFSNVLWAVRQLAGIQTGRAWQPCWTLGQQAV